MRTRNISLLLLVALAAFAVWWFLHGMQGPIAAQSADANNSATNNAPVQALTNAIISSPVVSTAAPPMNDAFGEKRRKEMEEDAMNGVEKWRTPIEFYGKVVDENANPIAGAEIDFDCNDTSPTGTSFYHTTSDESGMFSIKEIKGMLLVVKVKKRGYYPKAPAGYAFYYAGQNQNFVPDATKPVIFDLRKKGAGEALIHFHKSIKMPRDGTPVEIDLATGNVTTSGDNAIKVECWTFDKPKKAGWKYDWKCRISILGGKLETYNDPYPFLAPADGYVADDVIDMTVTNNPEWKYDVERNYYFQTGGAKFGRMVFAMIAGGDNFCDIDAYFNPSGSRNLEPVPSE